MPVLKQNEKKELEKALDGMSFSCGAQLQDSDIPEYLKDVVFVRKISCEDPIEKLYYSAKFEDICVYCSGPVPPWSDTARGILSSMQKLCRETKNT